MANIPAWLDEGGKARGYATKSEVLALVQCKTARKPQG